MLYGILEFTSKSRIQGNGIPFQCDEIDKRMMVKVKKERLRDAWAKVSENGELVEIIGPVGEKEPEVYTLMYKYGILPCKYPSLPVESVVCGSGVVRAFTVDNADTLDRDDAISVVREHGGCTIGIHITDVTGIGTDWIKWAKKRASSAYWQDGNKGMFPSKMQESLSLDEGKVRPCLSLYLHYLEVEGVWKHVATTESWDNIYIERNLTYEEFSNELLTVISGETDATNIIAWCMIQYNLHFAKNNLVLRRVQKSEETSAVYAWDGTHATMGHVQYGHFTSPMRRFADLYNQLVLKGLNVEKLDVEELNARMHEVQQFHRREVIVSLAYRFKERPEVIDAKIVIDEEDGKHMMLYYKGQRIRIRNDSYGDFVTSGKYEIFGLHKNGKATLRVRHIRT